MGNVGSRLDEGPALYLRDQNRLTVSYLSISSPRRRSAVIIVPNAFPASRVSASRPFGETAPVEFVQDAEPASPGAALSAPNFILKLANDDELTFTFKFIIRQTQQQQQQQQQSLSAPFNGPNSDDSPSPVDTNISGLTFIHGSTSKEVENLVTREFHLDPNLHKNSQVELVGDYGTGGSASVTFEWKWTWKPPRPLDERGSGWRNSCSFVEYDARAHKLLTLASFSFWVTNVIPSPSHPSSPTSHFALNAPPKIRVGSAQSVDSRFTSLDQDDPPSPLSASYEMASGLAQTPSTSAVKVDVACPKPSEDYMTTVGDDGPLFRATIKGLELKTGNMRTQVKKVLKRAEQAYSSQLEANDAFVTFMDALREASTTNEKAVQPAIEHYFDKIACEILAYERQNAANLHKLIIEPLARLYTTEIKQAENKKREFEEESKDYYAYLSRYLGQRLDSAKAKKLAESDSKYQFKRRNFELKRFDYSSFVQDLHGGRKEQEVLSHLTKYANAQTKGFLATARKVDEMQLQLEALSAEVQDVDKGYQYQRLEREEKRRQLEKSTGEAEMVSAQQIPLPVQIPSVPQPSYPQPAGSVPGSSNGNNGNAGASHHRHHQSHSDSELGRADSTGSQLRGITPSPSVGVGVGAGAGAGAAMATPIPGAFGGGGGELSRSPGGTAGQGIVVGSPGQNFLNSNSISTGNSNSKFKGIRDLEERDPMNATQAEKNTTHRKEGLIWALSRPPGLHVDPRALKQWHKFWIVLDQGKLSEYSNWKQRLDLHMEPIDLRMASVREARNAERRFCFEVITPQFKRVYQATSEEDMNSWISAINNALQSAVERGLKDRPDSMMGPVPSGADGPPLGRDIGSILTGKTTHSLHLNHIPAVAALSSGAVSAGPSVTAGSGGFGGGGVFGGGSSGGFGGGSGGFGGINSSSSSAGIPARRTTVGARPSANSRAGAGCYDENPDRLLQTVRENDQGNCFCADCGSNAKVEWVSINLGIILCIECSGIHRSLGTHISKVRSLTLDITSFTPDIVEVLLLVGNRVSNMVWEARLDPAAKPTPQASRDQRLRFITAKYADRAYVEPISATLSHYATADETLLAAIKKNEIQRVLYALALRANPNITDRSRDTHSVYLALAAADPAPPSPSPMVPVTMTMATTPGSSFSSGSSAAITVTAATPGGGSTDPEARQTAFAVAELLLQNGAELPATPPAFPLSRSAQQFVDQRRIRTSASVTPSLSTSERMTSTTMTTMMQQRGDKDSRLQKRVSAGGRLAKSPIPER